MSDVLHIRRRPSWASGFEDLPLRKREDVCGIVVHRIEVSQEDPSFADHPDDIVRFFREHPIGVRATGGAMPYPILIEPDGTVTQTLPLGRASPHAVSHNPTTVGVAVIGDFRGRAPSAAQMAVLPRVCASLLVVLGQDATALHGHDELPGASRDPDKICPGTWLPMDELRRTVTPLLASASDPGFAWL